MNLFRCFGVSAGLLLFTLSTFAAAPKTLTGKSTTLKSHRHASMRRASTTGRKSSHTAAHAGAVPMPTERATQIQTALIKQGYLKGEPTGAWDPQTVAAMEKLQADNGWQSRITPDARALIKLGLGPTTEPEPTREDSVSAPR
jgi:peptidoglycan hydrolase-like protein with peptidoglycan-binding domain